MCGINVTVSSISEGKICEVEHLLCCLHTHPPTCRASASYFANVVCSERKPLLQMVQLSALNRGFVRSLVVKMALTCYLCSPHTFPLLLCLFLSSN